MANGGGEGAYFNYFNREQLTLTEACIRYFKNNDV